MVKWPHGAIVFKTSPIVHKFTIYELWNYVSGRCSSDITSGENPPELSNRKPAPRQPLKTQGVSMDANAAHNHSAFPQS